MKGRQKGERAESGGSKSKNHRTKRAQLPTYCKANRAASSTSMVLLLSSATLMDIDCSTVISPRFCTRYTSTSLSAVRRCEEKKEKPKREKKL